MPDWRGVLKQIQNVAAQGHAALDLVRHEYLKKLSDHRTRNVIAYYSGFLSKPNISSDINDEDKNGFMMAVHKLDRTLGLDLILHTPGGSVAAAQSLVHYLHQMFPAGIEAFVPQIAMSAGAMVACACNRIWMAKHSNLGPIDPFVRNISAYEARREFRRAYKQIQKEPARLDVWEPILRQYKPTFLGECDQAIRWSNRFVEEQLRTVMFAGESDASKKAKKIVKNMTGHGTNKSHERHIHADECQKMGLKVSMIEDDADLQDLVLTVHHCYMHVLMNTPSTKIIENHAGAAFVKQLPPKTTN